MLMSIEEIQQMFSKSNMIYKITKDIDLQGGTLTIPEGCTLDFQGGSFSNGTIIGNNTDIDIEKCVNVDLSGTFSNLHTTGDLSFSTLEQYQLFPKIEKKKYLVTVSIDNSEQEKTIYLVNGDTSFPLKGNATGITQVLDLTNADWDQSIYVNSLDIVKFTLHNFKNSFRDLRIYETFTDLKSDQTVLPYTICLVEGYYHRYDGGDALWTIEPASSSYNLHTTVPQPNRFLAGAVKILDNGLAAILLMQDPKLNVLKLGVKNTGEDTTDELKELLNSTTFGNYYCSTLYFPGGRYLFTDTIVFNSSVNLLGDMPITIGDFSSRANTNPLWDDAQNLINGNANGNSLTIFRFDFGTQTDKNCIEFNNTSSVNNIAFTNNSFELLNPLGGDDIRQLPDNPLSENIIYQGITCLDKVKSVSNCSFIGFSDKAINTEAYSYVQNCYFQHCNVCFKGLTDCNVHDIRAGQCVTIADVQALSQVSNIRGDSVRGPVFIVQNGDSQLYNIEVDYCLKSLFNISGNGTYIQAKTGRNQINTWNNNIDDGGSVEIDECLVYLHGGAKNVTVNLSFIDACAIDGGDIDERRQNRLYPVVLGVDCRVYNLHATIDYSNSNYNNLDDNPEYQPSLKRLVKLSSNGDLTGRIISNSDFYLFNRYTLQNTSNYTYNFFYNGSLDNRPQSPESGFQYFDQTVGKLLIWNGTTWVTSDGLDADSTGWALIE